MAALAICAVTTALLKDRTDTQAPLPVRADQPPPAEPGTIPLTMPQIKRLLAALTTRPLPFDVELFHLLLHAGLSRRFLTSRDIAAPDRETATVLPGYRNSPHWHDA